MQEPSFEGASAYTAHIQASLNHSGEGAYVLLLGETGCISRIKVRHIGPAYETTVELMQFWSDLEPQEASPTTCLFSEQPSPKL